MFYDNIPKLKIPNEKPSDYALKPDDSIEEIPLKTTKIIKL